PQQRVRPRFLAEAALHPQSQVARLEVVRHRVARHAELARHRREKNAEPRRHRPFPARLNWRSDHSPGEMIPAVMATVQLTLVTLCVANLRMVHNSGRMVEEV